MTNSKLLKSRPKAEVLLKGLAVSLLSGSLMFGLSGCGTTPEDEFAGVGADKLYAEAREEAADGNFESAIKRYEKVEARASGTMMAQQAQLELAYAYFKTGERAQALAKVERFMRLHPTSPAVDYAMYLQGIINFNDDLGLFGSVTRQDLSERDQQAARDAYESFKQLTERFPDSKYSPDARLRMNYIVNSLAASEVHVARYYFRRGAYLAAANRAQAAIKDFRNSPSTEEALFVLYKSYDALGMVPLRDDALRVLQKNFPNSELLQGRVAGSNKPWWRVW